MEGMIKSERLATNRWVLDSEGVKEKSAETSLENQEAKNKSRSAICRKNQQSFSS